MGKCIFTGRVVALKIMKENLETEYQYLKVHRELQILRKLNQICDKFGVPRGTFVTELIEVIVPK